MFREYIIDRDDATIGQGITRLVTDTDTIKVSFRGAGELDIEKTVKNITQNETETRSDSSISDDILEYTIHFINNGLESFDTVKLSDAVPEFTELSTSVCCSAPVIKYYIV